MRKKSILIISLLLFSCCFGCSANHTQNKDNWNKEQIGLVEKSENDDRQEEGDAMRILIKSNEHEIIYQLNESQAAKDLYNQLPMIMEVKDFSTNEKTFYPPRKLDIVDAPLANADIGTLAYYSPWDDVVMFYDYFGKGNNLYTLGEAISGKENIAKLTGDIEVTKYEK